MKEIKLLPTRHHPPVCSSYQDLEAVLTFERAMRVHRAHVESFKVIQSEPQGDTAYQVVGTGGSYVVDLIDSSGRYDACTCPDFLGNGLGACKHIEAVRRALASPGTSRALSKVLPTRVKAPTLTVFVDGDVTLRAVGSWDDELAARFGFERGSGVEVRGVGSGTTLIAGRDESGVRIVHAAVLVLERLRAQRRLQARRVEVASLIAARRIGVDVLSRPLFAYQERGVAHLIEAGRALLADDMGLGKTVQAIAACEVLLARGEAKRVVVVTPASLKHQWAKEIQTYAGRPAVVVEGAAFLRRQAFASDAPYKILSYELTWRELARLRELDADVLILDEAQRAKNFRTKTATTLRAIPSRFLFVLTGTPVENRLDDLFSLLQLIDPETLGPLWRFNLQFHQQNHKGRIVGYKNLGQLRQRIAPLVLRRRKDEVLTELPALTEQTRYIELTAEQKVLEADYRALAARLAAQAEKRPLTQAEIKQMLMALLKARQACNAAELCDPTRTVKRSPKLEEFEELVGEIAAQGTSKVLVFSEWVEMLKLAALRLDKLGLGYAMLHGSIPSAHRPALLDRFRNDPDQRVLLSSDAGGVGLNLQVASYVIHLDLPWNPARLDQRTARAHRLGQTRGVSVTYLCAVTGIERGIEGTLAGKRSVRSAVLDEGSTVEELEAPSFVVFLRQLREVLEVVAEPGKDVEVVEAEQKGGELSGVDVATLAEATAAAEAPAGLSPNATILNEPVGEGGVIEPSTTKASAPEHGANGKGRAKDRLRLARVVLDAGFAADALRAAYEALRAAISGMLENGCPAGHAALVAAVYRDLLPNGRIAPGAPAALARLHDLTSLEEQGVEVSIELATEAVEEADGWIARLGS